MSDKYLNQDEVIDAMDRVCRNCDHNECYRKQGREYCPVMTVIDNIMDLSAVDVESIIQEQR